MTDVISAILFDFSIKIAVNVLAQIEVVQNLIEKAV